MSVDVVATSEVSVSLTVKTKQNLDGLIADISRVADVKAKSGKAIVTIICDVERSSAILAAGFAALAKENINVQMISQGASKVNFSMICDESESNRVVQVLHQALFGEKEGDELK